MSWAAFRSRLKAACYDVEPLEAEDEHGRAYVRAAHVRPGRSGVVFYRVSRADAWSANLHPAVTKELQECGDDLAGIRQEIADATANAEARVAELRRARDAQPLARDLRAARRALSSSAPAEAQAKQEQLWTLERKAAGTLGVPLDALDAASAAFEAAKALVKAKTADLAQLEFQDPDALAEGDGRAQLATAERAAEEARAAAKAATSHICAEARALSEAVDRACKEALDRLDENARARLEEALADAEAKAERARQRCAEAEHAKAALEVAFFFAFGTEDDGEGYQGQWARFGDWTVAWSGRSASAYLPGDAFLAIKGGELDGAIVGGVAELRKIDAIEVTIEGADAEDLASRFYGVATSGPEEYDHDLITFADDADADGDLIDLGGEPAPPPHLLPWLAADAVTCLYAKADAGKTTFLLDQLVREAVAGRLAVLWIVLDMMSAFQSGMTAALRRHGVTERPAGLRPLRPGRALDLAESGRDWNAYILPEHRKLRARCPERPIVVVIESLSAALAGADENGSGTASFVSGAGTFAHNLPNTTLVFTHHPDAKDQRPRGHSSITGNCEAQVRIVENGSVRTVVMEKSKAYPRGTVVAKFTLASDKSGVPQPIYDAVPGMLPVVALPADTPAAEPSQATTVDETDAGCPAELPEPFRPLWCELAARGAWQGVGSEAIDEAARIAFPAQGEDASHRSRRKREKDRFVRTWMAPEEIGGEVIWRLRLSPAAPAANDGEVSIPAAAE